MPLMVSISGIRGIVGEDLTPEVLIKYISSFTQLLRDRKKTVLIGRDTRGSGEVIARLIEGTFAALGVDVINIGISTTPTVLLMTRKMNCSGGIAITASHNPLEWNAMKFCDEKGLFLRVDSINKIQKYTQEKQISNIKWKSHDEIGNIKSINNIHDYHIDEVLKNIHSQSIRERKLRVAIDPAGGAGSVITREFLKKLDCEIFGINERPNGLKSGEDFPRPPEPVPKNLNNLCELVKSSNADIGFAQDPDGDRLAVVDENGKAIGEEYTLVLSGESYLKKRRTDIVCNLSTSMMIDDLARRFSVKVLRTKIGEINVTSELIENNLHFGGEGNGGVIVPEINPCRDSIVAMGFILELLSNTGKTVSEIIKEFPSYSMKKDRVDYKVAIATHLFSSLLKRAKESFKDHLIDNIDGIKIYNKYEWLHIRPSNTEPVIRIMAEAKDEKRSEELIAIGKTLIESL